MFITSGYIAFTTRNLARRQMFWTEPWPFGIHGVPRCTMVDIDEFGLHLNAANKKYGSSPRGLEIRKPGNETKAESYIASSFQYFSSYNFQLVVAFSAKQKEQRTPPAANQRQHHLVLLQCLHLCPTFNSDNLILLYHFQNIIGALSPHS